MKYFAAFFRRECTEKKPFIFYWSKLWRFHKTFFAILEFSAFFIHIHVFPLSLPLRMGAHGHGSCSGVYSWPERLGPWLEWMWAFHASDKKVMRQWTTVNTHADIRQSRGTVFPRRLSVSVCFPHDISKRVAARITKRDTEMFHHQSWELIFWVKFTKHKNSAGSAGMGLWMLASSSFAVDSWWKMHSEGVVAPACMVRNSWLRRLSCWGEVTWRRCRQLVSDLWRRFARSR